MAETIKQETAKIAPDGSKADVSAVSDVRSAGLDPVAVWPPPPKNRTRFVFQAGRTQITPEAASSFFLVKSMVYGLGFGAAYSAVVGIVILIATNQFAFSYGVLYDTPYGGILGFILGIADGIVLAYFAGHLVRKGVTVPVVARKVRRAAPVATIVVESCIVAFYYLAAHTFDIETVVVIYAVSLLASWHAAWIATNKFMDEYE